MQIVAPQKMPKSHSRMPGCKCSMINLPHISRFPIIYISIWLWGLYISYDSRYAKSFDISGKAGGFVEVIPGTFWVKIHTFGAYI